MSGKYQNKQKTAKSRLPLLIALTAALLLGGLFLWKETAAPEEAETLPTTQATLPEAASAEVLLDLGSGLTIRRYGSYTGVFMEDGTDEVISDVLYIQVTNEATQTLQYAEITLKSEAGEAVFSLSTLPPGESAIVLESSRLPFGGETYTEASVHNLVFFSETLSLREDALQIQPYEQALNITNISGNDITGDIVLYYKNYADGMYYGGITYRTRITGGLKADSLQQVMPNHFHADSSRILFVQIP